MELTAGQIERFQEDGFLIFRELFSPEEVERLREEAERVAGLDAECVFREGSSGVPKTMFRLHAEDGPTASPAYHAAAHAPRILRPAQQALGTDEVYIHHCKVNMKAAIEGSAWPWHQDFGTWHLDGIAEPTMATFLVMLDEATEMNGCLYFLPGSHRDGRVDPYFDSSTSYSLWASKPEDDEGGDAGPARARCGERTAPAPRRCSIATCCTPRAITSRRQTAGMPISASTPAPTGPAMWRTRARTMCAPPTGARWFRAPTQLPD